uniref:Serpentine receptor class gamma n=1 Tax=Parastrongyloides trichosuri TaxID=131310 RepID=A0A0N4ZJ16_PARTI
MYALTMVGIALTVYYIITFVFDIFSFFLYATLLVFLIRRLIKKDPHICSSFFVIVIFNGFTDLLFMIEEYFCFRIPQVGLFEYFYTEIFPSYLISGMCYTYSICQLIFIALSGITLTVNRLFAIIFPINYQKFWSSWRLIPLIGWPLIICIPLFIKFYYAEVDYEKDETGRISVFYIDTNLNNILWSSAIYTHIFAIIVNGILNIILIYKLKKEFNNTKKNKKEIKLDVMMAKFAFFYFIFFLLTVAVEIGMVVASNNGKFRLAADLLTSYAIVESSLVYFTPYTLLILSKDIRIKFLSFIRLDKSKVSNLNSIGQTNLEMKQVYSRRGTVMTPLR